MQIKTRLFLITAQIRSCKKNKLEMWFLNKKRKQDTPSWNKMSMQTLP